MSGYARRAEKRRERQEEEERQQAERHERWHGLWNVPERARDGYLSMQDNFGPESVLEFMKAMLPEEDA